MRKNKYLTQALEDLSETTMAEISPVSEVTTDEAGGPEQIDSIGELQDNEAALEAELADAELAESQATNEIYEKDLDDAVTAASALESLAEKLNYSAKATDYNLHVISAYANAMETVSAKYGGVMSHPAMEALSEGVDKSEASDAEYREVGAKTLSETALAKAKSIIAAVVAAIKRFIEWISELVKNVFDNSKKQIDKLEAAVEHVKDMKVSVGSVFENPKLGKALGMIKGKGDFPAQATDYIEWYTMLLFKGILPKVSPFINEATAAVKSSAFSKEDKFIGVAERFDELVFDKLFNTVESTAESDKHRVGYSDDHIGGMRFKYTSSAPGSDVTRGGQASKCEVVPARNIDDHPKLKVPSMGEITSLVDMLKKALTDKSQVDAILKSYKVAGAALKLVVGSQQNVDYNAVAILRRTVGLTSGLLEGSVKNLMRVSNATTAFIIASHRPPVTKEAA